MKYVVALNCRHALAVQLNALGHVGVGLAHLASKKDQAMRSFRDVQRTFIGLMSDHPFIILSARNSSHLLQAHLGAMECNVVCNAFTIDMKDNTPEYQEAALAASRTEVLDYVALGFWGAQDMLRPLTRRFSLYQ